MRSPEKCYQGRPCRAASSPRRAPGCRRGACRCPDSPPPPATRQTWRARASARPGHTRERPHGRVAHIAHRRCLLPRAIGRSPGEQGLMGRVGASTFQGRGRSKQACTTRALQRGGSRAGKPGRAWQRTARQQDRNAQRLCLQEQHALSGDHDATQSHSKHPPDAFLITAARALARQCCRGAAGRGCSTAARPPTASRGRVAASRRGRSREEEAQARAFTCASASTSGIAGRRSRGADALKLGGGSSGSSRR